MLGELCTGEAYYRLEDANYTGSGVNLTTNGTVNFVRAKYSNGADFGTTGTNHALYSATNIMSSLTPDKIFVTMRVKFNATANITATLWAINTRSDNTSGRQYFSNYTMSAGVCTLRFYRTRTTTLEIHSVTFTPNTTDYYFFWFRRDGDRLTINVYDSKIKTIISTALVSSGTGASSTAAPAVLFSLGNNRLFSQSGRVVIDEFHVSTKDYYTDLSSSSSRFRYRNHMVAKHIL